MLLYENVPLIFPIVLLLNMPPPKASPTSARNELELKSPLIFPAVPSL